MTTQTTPLGISCCSCKAAFKNRAKNCAPWRQRSLPVPGAPDLLFAYLCGDCAARFTSDDAVHDFLDASLEDALCRITHRAILVAG